MDSEILYSLIGVLGFIGVIYLTLRGGFDQAKVRTKDEKRSEIIENYKSMLEASLKDFDKDEKMRKDKKIMLLKEYSQELSKNIFFDNDEIKEIILELSAE